MCDLVGSGILLIEGGDMGFLDIAIYTVTICDTYGMDMVVSLNGNQLASFSSDDTNPITLDR